MVKKAAVCAAMGISLLAFTEKFSALAEVSYSYNSYGEAVQSQAGYTAVRAVSGTELGCGGFSGPSDIFAEDSGNFFVADTGNNRIVEIDPDFTMSVREYSVFIEKSGAYTTLSEPEGIFVSDDGYMYIADTGNSRIIVSDMECNIRMIITKPESSAYENETFKPLKVIADKSGNVYSVLNNVTNGAAFFSSSGEFSGYFGANRVELSAGAAANYLKNLFATDKMRASSARNAPYGITGFDIDREGFVYTVTESSVSDTERVKKINAGGVNLFADLDLVFGDLQSVNPRLTDIDVDALGRICCLDRETGRVFQYDENGSLLFIMGGKGDCVGNFSVQPTAVESAGNSIFVTDGQKNTVTIFEETSFGEVIHRASELYNEGRYDEALEPWMEALSLDGNNSAAYLGMSASLLSKGDYKGAMEYAELGGSSYYYNKAFECYRDQWLDKNFSYMMAALIICIVLRTAFRKCRKRRRKKYEEETRRI